MRLYKLTDKDGRTYNGTQWGESITHTAKGDSSQLLCSNAWIHAYESPEIAVLLNPAHGDFRPFRLWEAEGEIGKRDGQSKCGCRTLTVVREILEIPVFTREQRVRFAIHCVAQMYKENSWRRWAERWLTGQDRSCAAAYAAADAAYAAAYAAADAASSAAYYAANVANAAYYDAAANATTDAAAHAATAAAVNAANAANAVINILAAIEFCKSSSNELPEVK
jgi:hypothetical protein